MSILENNLSMRSRQKLYVILANISLILLFYGIWEIKWVTLDVGSFLGLTSKLTNIYWLGLSLITVCSILVFSDKDIRNNWIFIYVLIILGFFIIGLGVFAEENARISTSYYPPGEVRNILENNGINITSPYPLLSYRSWPGIHIMSIYVLYMTNMDLDTLIKYMTLPWLIYFVFITFSIGNSFELSPNRCFLLSFLTISSFWTSHHYHSPQSFAFLIYLLIFLFTISISDSVKKKYVSVVIFSFMVITHLLTTVATLLPLFTTLIYKRYKRMKIGKDFILLCVIFLIWHLYFATTVLKWGVPDTVGRIVNMESVSTVSAKLHPTSLTELLCKVLQFAYIFIFTIPVGIFLYNYRKKEYRERDFSEKTMLNSIIFWLSGLVFLTVAAYGSEIFERLYLYSSVPLACFMIISLKNYRHSNKIFVCIMVIFVVMIIPAHYGNEIQSITYTTELKGTDFLSKIIQPQSPYYDDYFYQFSSYVWYFNPNLILAQHNSFDSPYDYSVINQTRYIVNSRHTDDISIFNFGFNPTKEWLDKGNNTLDLLYNNGEFDIYKNIHV